MCVSLRPRRRFLLRSLMPHVSPLLFLFLLLLVFLACFDGWSLLLSLLLPLFLLGGFVCGTVCSLTDDPECLLLH